MLWVFLYLAVGGVLVAYGWARGLYAPYLQRRDVTFLKKGGGSVRKTNYRDWPSFVVAQLFTLFFWPAHPIFQVYKVVHDVFAGRAWKKAIARGEVPWHQDSP